MSSPFVWRRLTSLDVSRNAIESVDASLASLAPQLRRLDVSHNRLTGLASLSSLSSLEELSLAHNLIEQLRDLHTKLGNVKVTVCLKKKELHLKTESYFPLLNHFFE